MHFTSCCALILLATVFQHFLPGIHSREVDIFFNEGNSQQQPGCCQHPLNDDELLGDELSQLKDEFAILEPRIRRDVLRRSDEIHASDACSQCERRRSGVNDLLTSALRRHRDVLRKTDLSLSEQRVPQPDLLKIADDLSSMGLRFQMLPCEKMLQLLDGSSQADLRGMKVQGRGKAAVNKRPVELAEEEEEEEEETKLEKPKKSSQKKQKAQSKKKPAKSSKSSKSKGKSASKKGKKDKKHRTA